MRQSSVHVGRKNHEEMNNNNYDEAVCVWHDYVVVIPLIPVVSVTKPPPPQTHQTPPPRYSYTLISVADIELSRLHYLFTNSSGCVGRAETIQRLLEWEPQQALQFASQLLDSFDKILRAGNFSHPLK